VLNPMQKLQHGSEFRSVLIIDDDLMLSESLNRILRIFFKECVVAADGEEGYTLFLERFESSHPFSLVITDLELPKKGGLGLIKDIRVLSKTQPILILSAHDESEFMAEAINLDVQGYLLKPLAMPKLFDSLEKVFSLMNVSNSFKIPITDSLTGWKTLPMLEQTLHGLDSHSFTMMYIRINYFTNICNLVGEEYANEYLFELSLALTGLNSDNEGTFYRCSEDELCLLFEGDKLSYAAALGDDMVSMARYFNISGRGIILNSTLSIAIATGKENILNHSKRVLETLSDISAGGIAFYKEESDENYPVIAYGQKILKLIFNALENESIIPFFQPIVNTNTQKIEIYESLMRIRSEDKLYGPDTFLNIAVDTHQMTMLTRAIIRNTLDYSRDLDPDSLISINLSGNDLNDEGLIPYITFCLEKYTIKAERIAFEIMGGMKFITSDHALLTVKALKAQGYKIIVNDFGLGMCDLLKVSSIAPDFIKLHSDLTLKLEVDSSFIGIIQKLIEVIHLIGSKAILKHISNSHLLQMSALSKVDCVQGYAVGLPFEVIREL